MTAGVAGPAWFNYIFDTDLDCPNRCGPGVHPLYVGKSNDAHRRLGEHEDKAWFRYSTGWRICPERYATEAEALRAETRRIHELRPLANDRDNRGNPCRMEFVATPRGPVARRSRAAGRRASVSRRRGPAGKARFVGRVLVGAAVVDAAGWWAACVFAHVVAMAGLVASTSGVAVVLFVWWALTFKKRSSARPVLLFCAVFAAAVGLWGLMGMPDGPSPVAPPAPRVQVGPPR